jgi:hypothetical protein
MPRKVLIFILLLSGTASAFGQEVVSGLYSDQRIKNGWEKRDHRKSFALTDTLELPFFDDFAQEAIFPESNRWADSYVFINNTYTKKQRSQGVATFDAIDNTGKLYTDASAQGFEADHLTSLPINLNYLPSDSIYLSFLYEPGGVADVPEAGDSLTLQFFSPSEVKWHTVWKNPGIQTDTFRAAIIRIADPKYLHTGFKFRFINYASLSQSNNDQAMMGNCDQWNVDYISLDKNRNSADTVAHDVALTLPLRSALKTYEAMPWKQFRQFFLSEMGSSINISYFNNDTVVRNVTRNFEIYDLYKNSVSYTATGGAANISALSPVTYGGPLIYTFDTTNPDSALFRIRSYLTTDIFDRKQNDTVSYIQRFGNYYAFDDGTSEAGYGINGLGSRNAMVAYRYNLLAPDTIRAVSICFNESYMDANMTTFNLMIWDDNGGVPGNVIRTETGMVSRVGDAINGFRKYILSDPAEINGTYYVGWQQTSEKYLNAGFDLNTPNAGRQFYYLNGIWNESQTKGSVMIRPVFGPRENSTGINILKSTVGSLKFWPNPATDVITVEKTDEDYLVSTELVISDLQGRELIRKQNTETVDVSKLQPGIYIIIKYTGSKPSGYGRLIKPR